MAKAKRETTVKKPFHEQVAEKLIEQLKQGTAPWQRPWESGNPNGMLPMNPTTGKRYKGINTVHLLSQGYSDNRWMTYNQAVATGAQVRKGEKGTSVQYWKFSEEQTKTDDNGKPIFDAQGKPLKINVMLERPRVFFAVVFNASQIDGLPILERPVHTWNPHDRAEQMILGSGAQIFHGESDRAFYRPSTDTVHLPERSQFPTADNYYAVTLHELGHWTGHASRLDRDLAHPFGSEGYAKEELRAEIASMIIGDELGIGHNPELHVSYVKSWIKALQDDPMEIFRAAADAEKIMGFMLELEQKHQQTQAPITLDAQQRLVDQLEELHKQAVPGYSPLESWKNLQKSAAEAGLVASLHLGRGGEFDSRYAIFYSDQNGRDVDIITDLYTDGKAVTSVNDQRVQGTGPTADPEWQTAALERAIAIANPPQISVSLETDKNLEQIAQRTVREILDGDPAALPAGGRLIDRLIDNDIMPIEQAEFADAYRDLHLVSSAPESDRERFSSASLKAFGFAVPDDWNGLVSVQGNVTEDKGGDEHITSAELLGVDPEFWSVYAQHSDGTSKWLADFDTALQADELADRLRLIDAYAATNEIDQAAKIARIREEQISRDPNSTEAQRSDAKEDRKSAEMQSMLREFAAQKKGPAAQHYSDQILSQLIENHGWQVAYSGLTEPGRVDSLQRTFEGVGPLGTMVTPNGERSLSIGYSADLERRRYVTLQLGAEIITDADGRDANPVEIARQLNATAEQYADQRRARNGLDPIYSNSSEVKQQEPKMEAPSKDIPATNIATEKTWLALPFKEKETAKKIAGTLPDGSKAIDWDKEAKCWYAYAGADLAKLTQWLPDGTSPRQAITPQEEFAQALRNIGAIVDGEHPIMDGKKHRIAVEGDAHLSGEKSGFYVAHLDGKPAGYLINNRTKEEQKWKSEGTLLSDEDKAVLKAEAATKLAARAEKQAQLYAKTALAVNQLLAIAPIAPADHPYLQRKGIDAGELRIVPQDTKGLPADSVVRIGKTYQESMNIKTAEPDAIVFTAGHLLMTGHNTENQITTVQTIREDGVKRFVSESQKEGSFHAIGGMDGLAKAPAIVIGEGYATAKAIGEVVGFATVSAFDSGNLLAVGKALKEVFPDKPIIFAGDDDFAQDLANKPNYGVIKAKEAAEKLGGTAMFPIFAPGERESDPKGFTDFNDLSVKSTLGREGVARQVNAVIENVVKKNQELSQSQTRTHSRPDDQDQRRSARH